MSAATIGTHLEGLRELRQILSEAGHLTAATLRFAEKWAADDDALAEFRNAADDLKTAIQDQAEPALAVLRQAERDLTGKDEVDEVEHAQHERFVRFAHPAAE